LQAVSRLLTVWCRNSCTYPSHLVHLRALKQSHWDPRLDQVLPIISSSPLCSAIILWPHLVARGISLCPHRTPIHHSGNQSVIEEVQLVRTNMMCGPRINHLSWLHRSGSVQGNVDVIIIRDLFYDSTSRHYLYMHINRFWCTAIGYLCLLFLLFFFLFLFLFFVTLLLLAV
jgi:hypothetical protein